MQFTDSLIVHFFSFSWICLFHYCENLPNKCTKMTRQKNTPKWPAKISCCENLPDSPARIIRWIYSPEKSAISTRGLLARDPPLPCSKSPGRTRPANPPPPHGSANGAGGRGQGAGPGHPRILNRYFSFLFPHFMNGYIFLYNAIHTYSTQSGLRWSINTLL